MAMMHAYVETIGRFSALYLSPWEKQRSLPLVIRTAQLRFAGLMSSSEVFDVSHRELKKWIEKCGCLFG